MLDNIYVLTLERSTDRHESWLGAAHHPLCGIPNDLIKFFIGIDAKDYNNDMQAVADAAVKDGFAFVEEYALGIKTEYVQQTAGSVAQVWSYARMLRDIAEKGETTLIIWDDKMLTVPFSFFYDVLTMLLDAEKSFHMWQLMLRGDLGEVGLPELAPEIRRYRSMAVFSTILTHTLDTPFAFLIDEGLRGYDETIVYSPLGAEWMLAHLQNANDFYYFFDHFLCFGLKADVTAALNDKKGFYCPTEFGYNFAEVYRPMGTLTDWAPEGSLHYEQSVRTIKPVFIGE